MTRRLLLFGLLLLFLGSAYAADFTYQPQLPFAGEQVVFEASESCTWEVNAPVFSTQKTRDLSQASGSSTSHTYVIIRPKGATRIDAVKWYNNLANPVTVRIYVDDTLVWEDTVTPNEYVDAGGIWVDAGHDIKFETTNVSRPVSIYTLSDDFDIIYAAPYSGRYWSPFTGIRYTVLSNSTTGQTATALFPNAGDYNVTCTSATASVSKIVPIYSAPEINAADAQICDTTCHVISADPRLTISTYEWNVGGGSIVSESAAQACVIYSMAGDYNITTSITLTDGNITRDVNLSDIATISSRTYAITTKDITGADFNADKVNSISGALYGLTTRNIYGTWSGPTATVDVSSMDCSDTTLLATEAFTRSTVSWSRSKLLGYDASSVTIYSPYGDTELFYTIAVTDNTGAPISDVVVHMLRYISDAWVPVDEQPVNPDGTVSVFLTPNVLYQIRITRVDGTEIYRTYYTPNPNNRTLQIRITSSAAEVNMTWDMAGSVEYVLPDDGQSIELNEVTGVTLSFSVHDFNNSLEYFFMRLSRNGALVYENNVTGSPSGGDIVYTTTKAGTYHIVAGYKQAGEPEITFTRNVVLYFNTGIAQFNPAELAHSPVAYLFVAAIITVAAMGLAVSFGASGFAVAAVGIAVLAAFIIPAAGTLIGSIPLHYVLALAIGLALAIAFLFRVYA